MYAPRLLPRFIAALRESLLSLLPLLVGVHALNGLAMLVKAQGLTLPTGLQHGLLVVQVTANVAWPLLLALALTVQLARAFDLDPLIAASLVLLLMLQGAEVRATPQGSYALKGWSGMGAVLLPLMAVGVMAWLRRRLPRMDLATLNSLSPALSRTLSHLLPFGLTYAVLSLLAAQASLRPAAFLAGLYDQLPSGLAMGLSVLAVNALWWIGVDGGIVWDVLTDNGPWRQAMAPGVVVGDFLYGFVYIGGCGCGLALTLALWSQTRNADDRQLLRWTTPFTVFNVSEPLVYGLPVSGSTSLLLPFVLIPLGVATVGWWVIVEWQWVHLLPGRKPWLLPAGLSAPLQGQSTAAALALQVASVALATLAWIPFVRRMVRLQTESGLSAQVSRALHLPADLEPQAEQRHVQRQEAWRTENARALSAIRLIEQGDLELHYQPKMALKGDPICSLEALVRLRRRDGELLPPAQFLPALDKAGFGDMFDLWVVQQALADERAWRAVGLERTVSVNLTATTLMEDQAIERILELMQGTPGAQLDFEVLESSLWSDSERLRRNLQRLRSHGAKVYVDDFGVGYSNLAVLHACQPDLIKIDQSLLQQAHDERGALLYREFCQTLSRLGYATVAEGVESAEQASFVRTCGVQIVQGWWLSHPIPHDQVVARVAAIEAGWRRQVEQGKPA